MTFKNRDAFKLHMVLYAIEHKFHFRHSRSTPDLMVLRCKGTTCPWRVYATRMDGCKLYEVRRASVEHSCTVDGEATFKGKLLRLLLEVAHDQLSNGS